VYGSGFKIPTDSGLFLSNDPYDLLDYDWNSMKFPLPPAKQGPKFEGSVLFETTANGVDFTKFPKGFYYYLQPNVTDIFPYYGPVNSNEPIRVFGGPFKVDFS
jgi:hypothetical protein